MSFGFELSACLAALTTPLCFSLALHCVVAFAEPLEVREVVTAAFFVGDPVVEFQGAGAFPAVCVLAFMVEFSLRGFACSFPFAC